MNKIKWQISVFSQMLILLPFHLILTSGPILPSILVANFRSVKNNQAELQAYLTLNKVDIILGTESHLNDSITNSKLFPCHYQIYR